MKGIQVRWPRSHVIGPPLPIQRPGNTVETGIELVARIIAAYDIIQNTPGIFIRVQQKLLRRCHVCIEVGGRQFEQLLQEAKWYVNCVNVLYLQVTVSNVNKK